MVTPTILAPGDKIDRYTILEPMAPFGHIERYLATAGDNDPTRVVIACAERSSRTPSEAEIHRLLQVLRALRKEGGAARFLSGGIRHEDDITWLAHEHVDEGASLADFAAGTYTCGGVLAQFKGGLHSGDTRDRYWVALALCQVLISTLTAFGAHGIVHGGLDPSVAIFVNESGLPVILGLGYGQIFGSGAAFALLPGSAFRAPEAIDWGNPDPRVDIYALGAIGYWIIAGTLPPRDSAGSRWDIPDAEDSFLELCIQRATERDPSRRYASWPAFKNHWDALYDAMMRRAALLMSGVGSSKVESSGAVELPQSGTRALPAPDAANSNRRPAPASGTAALVTPLGTTPPLESTLTAPTPRVPVLPLRDGNASDAPDVEPATIETSAPAGDHEIDVTFSGPIGDPSPVLPGPPSSLPPPALVQRRGSRLLWAGFVVAVASFTFASVSLLSGRSSPLNALGIDQPALAFVNRALGSAKNDELPCTPPLDRADVKEGDPLDPARGVEQSRAAPRPSGSTWGGSCEGWARCQRKLQHEARAQRPARVL